MLLLLFQLRNGAFKVFGEQLELVLDRDVLPDISFILLKLLLHRLTILLRVHAHLRRCHRVTTSSRERVKEVLRTMLSAGVLTGKKVACVVGEEALTLKRCMRIIFAGPFFRWQKGALLRLLERIGFMV